MDNMTAEEKKELLVKELSTRFPYHVKVLEGDVLIEALECLARISESDYVVNPVEGTDIKFRIENVKIYLRPISSMTDEEIDKLFEVLKVDLSGKTDDWIKINDVTGIKFFLPEGRWVEELVKAYDYLNSIHIDYRGSIAAGIAIEAPKDLY